MVRLILLSLQMDKQHGKEKIILIVKKKFVFLQTEKALTMVGMEDRECLFLFDVVIRLKSG